MSKKNTTSNQQVEAAGTVADVRNCMTPGGHKVLAEELRRLLKEERPKIVEVVAWAAGNGDRSENGDYIYGKKRLREIDRRVRYLTKRLDQPEIVDPKKQQGVEQVFFGATVVYKREDETEVTVKLVGIDEADFSKGTIYWLSPVGKALMKAKVGDEVTIRKESGIETIEVLEIDYIVDAPSG
ncbi:MAG: transcription elongation factor GreB [Pseudomonadota bacterium]|nr:transcription elongation factor GreB [Pseudomonadota bacterium]QKK04695.1 MAG: transcription elongation factor GreB [Pseudomonadota bacterium]